jgi:hypothetical protein
MGNNRCKTCHGSRILIETEDIVIVIKKNEIW